MKTSNSSDGSSHSRNFHSLFASNDDFDEAKGFYYWGKWALITVISVILLLCKMLQIHTAAFQQFQHTYTALYF